jgi:hypothetical protein
MTHQQVFVHGGAVTRSWRDESMSLNDLIFAAVSSALVEADVSISDVDSVVLGAHDITDGRGLSSMVTAPSAGAFMKDEVRLGDDGASAFVVGAARVRGGSSRYTLVAAWGRASEGQPERIANAMFDPFFTRPLGMTEVGVSALRAGAAIHRYDTYAESRERAAAVRDAHRFAAGAVADAAAPLRDSELPVWADVGVALVISSEPNDVEVTGVGMSTEPFHLGDRDLLGLPALRKASQQALDQAGTRIADVDVLELDGLSLFDEALALEAVGAASAGGGMAEIAGGVALNTDGGYLAGYCAPAMGLVRIAQATSRLRAGGSTALASGSSVVASQSQTAVALRRT